MEDAGLIRAKVEETFVARSPSAASSPAGQSVLSASVVPPSGSPLFARFRRRSEHTRLIKELQLHFGVYFSPEELESQYTAERMTVLIQQKLKRNKAGALRLLKHHAGGGRYVYCLILLNAVLALPLVYLARVSTTHAGLALAMALLANALFATDRLRDRNYNKKLIARIQQR